MISISRNGLLLSNLFLFLLFVLYFNHQISNLQQERQISYQKTPTYGSIIIYNRVPKTGSTTFTNAVAYDLGKQNGFTTVHLNMTKNKPVMSLPDQEYFIRNVSSWTDMQPMFLHGHVSFIDFTKFGYPQPIYINLLREPLDRLLSHYYFLRFGDNFRVGLKRSRAGNNETFDQCVQRGGHDCDVKQLWIQIPYFCGHHTFCSEVGNREALETAKRHLIEHYLLVGTSDRMRDFIAILDLSLPKFFRGALEHFDSLDETRSHLRSTKKKIEPSDQTISIIKMSGAYQLEREFYDFARNHFDAIFMKATNGTGKLTNLLRKSQFHYEKIKTFH
ncbi:unnamed protein product, partial [Mesorhabditis belari]|uniref:Heparan sulfate 2-O-sulfotransferase n=1 Tax=Mesorhabditis belari TaxID=2138241 RepID=A0AAF3EZ60_9BILA